MADPRKDQVGSVVVPATAAAAGVSLAATCDPVLVSLLAAFKTILRTKLDAAWSAAAGQLSSHVVEGTYPYEPIQKIAKLNWTWPALFLWRTEDVTTEFTQQWESFDSTLKGVLVLPPLAHAQAVKLMPILRASAVTLHMFIENLGDPSYSAGADILTACGLDQLRLTRAQYGQLPGDSGLQTLHPAVDLTFSCREREQMVTSQYETWSQSNNTVSVFDEDGGAGSTEVVETQYPDP